MSLSVILDTLFMIAGVVTYYAYSEALLYQEPEHQDLEKVKRLRALKWGALGLMAALLIAHNLLGEPPPQSS